MHVSAIIAAGGRGLRLGGSRPKQFLPLGGRTILHRSVDAVLSSAHVVELVVALPAELMSSVPEYLRSGRKPITVVEGGARRQDSVVNAFESIATRADIVVIHDAARPFVTAALIDRTVDAAIEYGAAIAAMAATDTVKRAGAERLVLETLPRPEVFLAQTPQAFRTEVLRDALAKGRMTADATDEALLAERAGHPVRLVEGDPRNVKITTADDLMMAERLVDSAEHPSTRLRIGNGYDLHRLVAGRPLILGGVVIPFEKGLDGHSDADAVCHAVTDAILGAAGAGDIGRHFPDTDAAWKGADSIALLRRAAALVADAGYRVVNVDVVVIAQRPKLVPHIDAIRANLAKALGIPASDVSVKGKTNEGVDSMGAGDSIATHAVALLART